MVSCVAALDDVIEFCNRLLEIDSFGDYGPNGLQVPGSPEVVRIATAVSAHLESIDAAIADGTDLLITHHGLFWDFHPRALSPAMAARLKLCFASDLSVAGYHLPLDAHPEIGNNAILARSLGFEPGDGDIGSAKGRTIGVVATRPDPLPAAEFFAGVERLLGQPPLVLPEGPEAIGSVGVVTGAGAGEIHTAIELGLDAFLTGEPAEHVMADAREGGINFIAGGHYATEKAGVERLGEMVAERFGVEHRFIDVPNPI